MRGVIKGRSKANKVHNNYSTNMFTPSSSASVGTTASDDISRIEKEREFHATKFHSLESHGEAFFQIIIQMYFMFLLVIMGTGTVIAGVNAKDFFNDICKHLLF